MMRTRRRGASLVGIPTIITGCLLGLASSPPRLSAMLSGLRPVALLACAHSGTVVYRLIKCPGPLSAASPQTCLQSTVTRVSMALGSGRVVRRLPCSRAWSG